MIDWVVGDVQRGDRASGSGMTLLRALWVFDGKRRQSGRTLAVIGSWCRDGPADGDAALCPLGRIVVETLKVAIVKAPDQTPTSTNNMKRKARGQSRRTQPR